MNAHVPGTVATRSVGRKNRPLLLGVAVGAIGLYAATLLVARITTPVTLPLLTAHDCAVRTVYHHAQDDWGQRALIAASVLNRFPAPGAVSHCSAPPLSPTAAPGATPDPYRLQSAYDAVDAVESGSYELPLACAGVTAFSLPEAAPRSQCVSGGLAFTSPEAR